MIFARQLFTPGHSRTFLIQASNQFGWEVREERDSQTTKRTIYDDWHRVERALRIFQAEVLALEHAGWSDSAISSGA